MTDDFSQLSPETIAQARAMYDDATPNAEICEFLGLTEKPFLDFRKAQGWPLRDRFSVPPRRPPCWDAEDVEPPPESLTPDELIARMEAEAAREFVLAERAMAEKRPRNAQAHLRMMGHLVKMLRDLTRMRGNGAKGGDEDGALPAPVDDPPRELQELRAELMRRIERYSETGSPV